MSEQHVSLGTDVGAASCIPMSEEYAGLHSSVRTTQGLPSNVRATHEP